MQKSRISHQFPEPAASTDYALQKFGAKCPLWAGPAVADRSIARPPFRGGEVVLRHHHLCPYGIRNETYFVGFMVHPVQCLFVGH